MHPLNSWTARTAPPARAMAPGAIVSGPMVWMLLCVGCQGTPSTPAASPAAQASAGPGIAAGAPATPAAASPRPQSPPELAAEPMDLPAGQTLGDLLPPVPKPAVRLGNSDGGPAEAVAYDCTEGVAEGYSLVKRLDIQLAPEELAKTAEAVQGCVLQRTVGSRPDPTATSGRTYLAVAIAADGSRTQHEFAEQVSPPVTLPASRQAAGHDATGWAALIATGDPRRPLLAVVTGRFLDGQWGEEVHYLREARILTAAKGGWEWSAGLQKHYVSIDVGQLRALCEGRADAAPADRGAGEVAAACARLESEETPTDAQASARLATRKKRLSGGKGGDAATDGDPQSIWLREARNLASGGHATQAIDLALRVDTVCGEPVAEAHAVIRQALTAAKVAPARVTPAQPEAELCEPLVDKPAPKRQRVEGKSK